MAPRVQRERGAAVCRKGAGGLLYCAIVAGITLIPWRRLHALAGVSGSKLEFVCVAVWVCCVFVVCLRASFVA